MPQTNLAYIEQLAAARRPEHALPQPLYLDPLVYPAEIDRIWRRGWLFACHACELPEPGDFVVYEVERDSVLILRGDDGGVRAVHNVCRHRGTLLCTEQRGRVGRIVCPYHQWVYARDGSLVSCRGMHEGVDKADLSLVPVHAREVAGLIWISLAAAPPPFEPLAEEFAPLVAPQGFERAKVAATVDYDVRANWKIVWENNRECYHCNVNHPQYIKANFDHYNTDDTSQAVRERIETQVARSETKWAEAGLAVTHKASGMASFPDPERGRWFAANRTPLVEGYVSESMDGRQVAPLMGDYADPDVGTLRLRTVPNFWQHASCDHAVSTRLTPAGPDRTHIRVQWLVRSDAEENRDYRLEEIMPFWQLTSEQDWELCERVQRGVASSGYVPGPLSKHKEYNVDAFLRWYLQSLST